MRGGWSGLSWQRAREEQMVCRGLREERGVGCWSAAGEGKMRRKKGQRARESEGEDLWRGEPVKDGCWPRKRKRDGRGGREKMLKISGEGQRRLLSVREQKSLSFLGFPLFVLPSP